MLPSPQVEEPPADAPAPEPAAAAEEKPAEEPAVRGESAASARSHYSVGRYSSAAFTMLAVNFGAKIWLYHSDCF